MIKTAGEGVGRLLELAPHRARRAAFFAVGPFPFLAVAGAFGGARARPLGRSHFAARTEQKHHYTPVRPIFGVALGLVGVLIELSAFVLGKHEQRIALAAPLTFPLPAAPRPLP